MFTMRLSSRLALLFILTSLLLPIGAASAEALQRSVSTSRQFLIYGPDPRLRGAISDLAEQTKKSVIDILGIRDDWKLPIVLKAEPAQANLPEVPETDLRFSQTGSGLKIQLDLSIGPTPNRDAIRRELFRSILLEMMYRNRSDLRAGTEFVQPPEWFLEGLLALSTPDSQPSLIELLQSVTRAGNMTPLGDLLRQRPPTADSQSRTLYRAYAFAVLKTLLDYGDGHRGLIRFINDLPNSPNDPIADFAAHFPGWLEGGAAGEKAWTAAIARLSVGDGYSLWSAAETEERLDRALRVEIQDGEKIHVYELEDYAKFQRNPAFDAVITRVNQDLLILSARANPLHHSLVVGYQEAVTSLARGKTKRLPARLAQLKNARAEIAAGTQRIDDYMNWFEATQLRTESGAFTEYLKTAERGAEPERQRRDPISVYMKAMENQSEN